MSSLMGARTVSSLRQAFSGKPQQRLRPHFAGEVSTEGQKVTAVLSCSAEGEIAAVDRGLKLLKAMATPATQRTANTSRIGRKERPTASRQRFADSG